MFKALTWFEIRQNWETLNWAAIPGDFPTWSSQEKSLTYLLGIALVLALVLVLRGVLALGRRVMSGK